MTKVQRLERENVELRAEAERYRADYVRIEGHYRRSNAAAVSLIRDVVNFLGPNGLLPDSIYGSKLLAALGKANALLHGIT